MLWAYGTRDRASVLTCVSSDRFVGVRGLGAGSSGRRSPVVQAGGRIRVEGRVFDGAGELVRDVLIEARQANAAGKHDHPADRQSGKAVEAGFRGWGRAGSDFETGVWFFETVKPGSVAGRHGRPMAPHINLWIAARGINIGLQTRLYFADEERANAVDPVLNIIEQRSRRKTLLARREMREDGPAYLLDIHLQGADETVFFDV